MHASSDAGAGLEVSGLACVRGATPLFAGIGLHVPGGATGVLLGPNGSGKSTLLRALAGLHEPLAGVVRWGGRPAALKSGAWRSTLAYAGHKSGHKEDLSVAENLALECALVRARVHARARHDVLEQVGLARQHALQVKRLSQGQKQRLTLARLTLSLRPLWLLDEPAAALDAAGRALLEQILRDHAARGGVAVIATHDAIDLAGRARVELRLE